jgi:hypothetical protein
MWHKRLIGLLPLFLLALPLGAAMRSKLFWIEFGGVVAGETSGFRFLQIIGNTSEQPLWLTVRQGDGASACEVTAKIEPKKHGFFQCDVAEVKPGKVPVAIAVFADEARTQQVESHRDDMRFSRRETAAMKDFVSAMRLPVTYEHIAFSAKLGFGAMLRHLLPIANGRLSISTSAIEYADSKRTLTVPVSRIRNVELFGVPNAPPWVVLIYEESGELKRAGFQPLLDHIDDVDRIVTSLQSAVAGAADDTAAVSGATLTDAMLRRDTVQLIVQNEKVLAPECSSKVVDTKIVEEPSNMAVKNLRPARGEWSEQWRVDRCGVEVAYGVKYTTDPRGGTFIAVHLADEHQ